jgi:adenosine deaminase
VRNLRELPKAHLHLHVDGAMRAETLAELARKYGVEAPMPTSYGSFDAFMATITAAAGCLRTEADVRRLISEIVEDAAQQGVRWLEPSMWPGLLGGRLGPDESAVDVVLDAGLRAGAALGVGFGLILAANRDFGAAAACDVARLAVSRAGLGVVGLGLDGDESAAGPELFVEAAGIARAGGLPCVPHAGELLGAEGVWRTLELLEPQRIMHGVRGADDPALVKRLAADALPLAVCPTSNALLSVVPSIAEHPLPALLAAGVPVSLNTDCPLFLGTTTVGEYALASSPFGLGPEQLAAIARTSLVTSSCPADRRDRALAGVDGWCAAMPRAVR